MEKSFDPKAVEARLAGFWEKNGWFAPAGAGTPYSIMIPPARCTWAMRSSTR
jgi:valyl-tRNA synthetase